MVLNMPVINIKKFLIKDILLSISITLKFKSDHEFNPKLEIIFSNDIENRRIPLPISGFNID